ncbi:MAG: ABC transporter permease, partial [Anaerolineaceae bacterium]|nr:ABC transporter permease [Anaerolineaceae bacterium]
MAIMPQAKPKRWWDTLKGQEALTFYLFILPWAIGFLLFTAGPIIASFVLGFMSYDIALPP